MRFILLLSLLESIVGLLAPHRCVELPTSLRRTSVSLSASIAVNSKENSQPNNVVDNAKILWEFTRPHTIIGSAVSLLSVFMFATPIESWLTVGFWKSALTCALPSLFMNLYITGLNQITDIEIDKINKPYLPIASGELSKQNAIVIVVLSLLLSALTYAVSQSGWPLLMTLLGSFVLGTCYSLPPFRLKRFPSLAAFCIVVVRGMLVNLGFFFQAKAKVVGAIGIRNLLDGCRKFPESVLATGFFGIFGLVIAFMKDVPDTEGDRRFAIPSLSVVFGPKTIFR